MAGAVNSRVRRVAAGELAHPLGLALLHLLTREVFHPGCDLPVLTLAGSGNVVRFASLLRSKVQTFRRPSWLSEPKALQLSFRVISEDDAISASLRRAACVIR